MHSPDTPSTCLAKSVGFPSSKRPNRIWASIMRLWKTLPGSRTYNPVCVSMDTITGARPQLRTACSPFAFSDLSVFSVTSAFLRVLRVTPVFACTMSFLVLAVLHPTPAQAQIRKLVEENGHIVFVNADENTPVR